MRTRLHNRLPRWHRRAVYLLTAWLLVTGCAWIVVAYLAAPAGEPLPAPHPWAGPLLALHGVAAYAALVCYALVGHAHLRTGWRVPALRSAGGWLGASIIALALTALGLYYIPAETAVSVMRWTHVAAGVAMPCWLVVHILRGRHMSGRPDVPGH